MIPGRDFPARRCRGSVDGRQAPEMEGGRLRRQRRRAGRFPLTGGLAGTPWDCLTRCPRRFLYLDFVRTLQSCVSWLQSAREPASGKGHLITAGVRSALWTILRHQAVGRSLPLAMRR